MVSYNFLLFHRGHINAENIYAKLIKSRQASKVNFTFYLSALSNQQELLFLFARFSINCLKQLEKEKFEHISDLFNVGRKIKENF